MQRKIRAGASLSDCMNSECDPVRSDDALGRRLCLNGTGGRGTLHGGLPDGRENSNAGQRGHYRRDQHVAR